MANLGFDNILGEQEIDTLFMEPENQETKALEPENQEVPTEETETTEGVTSDNLFEGDTESQPESVGSEDKKEVKEETIPDKGDDTSPQNFYSSIANALAVDGIFQNLDEESISKAQDADSFSELIEAEVNARLDEKQQRVTKALENGVGPDKIRQFENTLQYVNSIDESTLVEESERGEQLRRNVIYQDLINKGMTPSKAEKLTERSIDAGNDIEDAKEALQSNKEYFQNEYNKLLKEAQKRADAEKAERIKQSEKLKDAILNDKTLLGDMEISANVRKKIFDNISRPVYRDPETGEYLTALQKYEMEHRSEFLKYVGLFMTLTDNFRDFNSFVKGKVNKEVKRGVKELEQLITNTRRNSDGGFKMVSSAKEDPESFIGGNFNLAL